MNKSIGVRLMKYSVNTLVTSSDVRFEHFRSWQNKNKTIACVIAPLHVNFI